VSKAEQSPYAKEGIASLFDRIADLRDIEGGKFPQASALMNEADSQHLLCE